MHSREPIPNLHIPIPRSLTPSHRISLPLLPFFPFPRTRSTTRELPQALPYLADLLQRDLFVVNSRNKTRLVRFELFKLSCKERWFDGLISSVEKEEMGDIIGLDLRGIFCS